MHPAYRFLLALVLLSCCSWSVAQSPAGDTLLYVGTYSERGSEGIYVLRWDGDRKTLEEVDTEAGLESPSFLALHPSGKTLYSVNREGLAERPDWSSASAFAIDPSTGGLRPLGSASAFGSGACYVATDASGRSLFIGNYSSGDLTHFALKPDGSLGPLLDTIQHRGSGPVEGRQEGPHVHATVLGPENRYVYVTDLGADRIEVYRLRPGKSLRHAHSVSVPAGTGPRHLAFHPNGDFAYLAGELNSTVVAYRRRTNGDLEQIEQQSTLPPEFAGSNYNADIHVHPSGAFLYVSNRGRNSIAWFAIDPEDGSLTWRGDVATEGDWPRNFNLTPDGNFLLVANRRTDDIVIFELDPRSGMPVFTGEKYNLPSPVCLVFRTP